MAFACLCCGYKTIPKQPPGTYEICPICCWEDSFTDNESEHSNDVSLWQAQKNFDEFGACEKKWLDIARPVAEADERERSFKALYVIENEIIDEIRIAFAGVYRLMSLRQADVVDDYGPEGEYKRAGKLDCDTDWQEVPDERIAQHDSALSFLDPTSFRYYVPAYMVWTLKNFRTTDSCSDGAIVYALTPYPLDHASDYEFAKTHLSSFPDSMLRYHLERFTALDRAQSRAVFHFLRYMSQFSGFENAQIAIENYWGQFSEERERA